MNYPMSLRSTKKTINGRDLIEYWFASGDGIAYSQKIRRSKRPAPVFTPQSLDPMAKIDIDEYLIHSNECFQEFTDTDKLDRAPDNYYVGATDPRFTGDPNTANIPVGSLWHDTANGILKKLAPRLSLSGTTNSVVWIAITGDKFVTDEDGKIVGRIVPRVNVTRNPSRPSGVPINVPPKKTMSLEDLLKKIKNKEDILDEDAD
jgi:hypothetical protein